MTATQNTKGRSRKAAATTTDAEFIAEHGMIGPTGKVRTPRKLAAVPTPAEEPTSRKSLPNADRRSEATHPAGGSAVSHGKCPTCGARKGRVCSSAKTGAPTNFVHAPRMKAWEAAGSPSLPMPTPARKTAEGWVVVK